MDDIDTAAGVAGVTVYAHFPGKADIVMAYRTGCMIWAKRWHVIRHTASSSYADWNLDVSRSLEEDRAAAAFQRLNLTKSSTGDQNTMKYNSTGVVLSPARGRGAPKRPG